MRRSSSSSLILAVFLTVIVFVIAWKLVLPGYTANIAKSNALSDEINAANRKIGTLDQTKADLDSIDTAYKAITVSVSEGADEPNLISELEAIALKNGIVLPTISINTSSFANGNADNTAGIPIGIAVSVNGSFEQLNNFITSLEKSVKLMNIKSMSYTDSADKGLSLSLQIEAYSRPVTNVTSAASANGATGQPL